jgi:hypothetical protein
MALTSDSAFLTAWSNDIGFSTVFSRQVEAFGQPGDVLVGISTSGRSQNLVEAFRLARDNNIGCIALLGGDGGDLLLLSDIAIVVPTYDTARIQEIQIIALHLLCELVESHFISEQILYGDSLLSPASTGVTPQWRFQRAAQLSYRVDETSNIGKLPSGFEQASPVVSKAARQLVNKKKGR